MVQVPIVILGGPGPRHLTGTEDLSSMGTRTGLVLYIRLLGPEGGLCALLHFARPSLAFPLTRLGPCRALYQLIDNYTSYQI
nr:MAG: hypothetical protein [Crogonang virus 171]